MLLVPFLYPFGWVKEHLPELRRYFMKDRDTDYLGNKVTRRDLDLAPTDQMSREYVNTELDTENAQFIVPLSSTQLSLRQDKATRELDVTYVDIFGTIRKEARAYNNSRRKSSYVTSTPAAGRRVDI